MTARPFSSFERELLESQPIAQVATLAASGAPHLASFWFSFDDQRLFLDTVENKTIRNLRRDPRVAVLADVGATFEELKGVAINGRAELHAEGSAPDRVLAGIGRIRSAHRGEIETPLFRRYLERERRDVVLVEVTVESIVSWDLAATARS